MAQYLTGWVSTTLGSNIVTGDIDGDGNAPEWLTYLESGDVVLIDDYNAYFTVASVDSDTQITLTANFPETLNDVPYVAGTDFTSALNLLLANKGDLRFDAIFSRNMLILDGLFAGQLSSNNTWTGTQTFSNTVTFNGALNANGNTTLGNAAGDTLTINSNAPTAPNIQAGTAVSFLILDSGNIIKKVTAIPDSFLSANIALRGSSNTFGAPQTFSNTVTLSAVTSGTATHIMFMDSSNNVIKLSSLADSFLSNNVVLENASNVFTVSQTFTHSRTDYFSILNGVGLNWVIDVPNGKIDTQIIGSEYWVSPIEYPVGTIISGASITWNGNDNTAGIGITVEIQEESFGGGGWTPLVSNVLASNTGVNITTALSTGFPITIAASKKYRLAVTNQNTVATYSVIDYSVTTSTRKS